MPGRLGSLGRLEIDVLTSLGGNERRFGMDLKLAEDTHSVFEYRESLAHVGFPNILVHRAVLLTLLRMATCMVLLDV